MAAKKIKKVSCTVCGTKFENGFSHPFGDTCSSKCFFKSDDITKLDKDAQENNRYAGDEEVLTKNEYIAMGGVWEDLESE